MVPEFSAFPSLPALIAANPDAEVADAVAKAMTAEIPLSNLYFGKGIEPEGFAKTLVSRLSVSAFATREAVSRAAVDLRASYSFRADHDPAVKIWHGGDAADWTIVAEESTLFATPPAPHTLFLKPWPENPEIGFRFVADELPGILVFPADLDAPIAGVPVLPMVAL